MKFCKTCQMETERNSDGKCKKCVKARSAVYYLKNSDSIRKRTTAYKAANPDKYKSLDKKRYAENRDKSLAAAMEWQKNNKERANERKRKWASENKEKVKLAANTWAKSHPDSVRRAKQTRRAKIAGVGGTLSRGLAQKLFELQKGKCACCSQPLGEGFHMDHIMPIALGGSNTDDNIQLLRKRCNHQKNAKHPIDFMQAKGKLL